MSSLDISSLDNSYSSDSLNTSVSSIHSQNCNGNNDDSPSLLSSPSPSPSPIPPFSPLPNDFSFSLSSSPSPCPSPSPPSICYDGELQLIYGPMFSGKSTELFRRIRRYQFARQRCLVIKYSLDTRYDQHCAATHDKITMDAISTTLLSSIPSHRFDNIDVIGIDEGQFFPDIVDFCESHSNGGRIVLVAALDGTFERKPFGNILSLIPLAEHVVKLTSVCMECGGNASFSKRIGNEKGIEVIGGADKYTSSCRKCFYKGKENEREKENEKEKEMNMTQFTNISVIKPKLHNVNPFQISTSDGVNSPH